MDVFPVGSVQCRAFLRKSLRTRASADESILSGVVQLAAGKLRHRPWELQMKHVASPRNHFNLQREGLGFWGPLASYRRAEHRREISLQFDSERPVDRRHDDGVDQPSERVRGFRAGFWTF